MSADDERADAAAQLSEILIALVETGGWTVMSSAGGVTLTRAWPDHSADTAHFVSLDTAYAQREDGDGREIWRKRGTAQQVAEALAELRDPGQPGAPDGTAHTPGPSGLWGH